jgi:taurine dioxygenase
MTQTLPFTVERTSRALGAVLTGLDIAAGVDDATLAAVQRVFLEHKIIVIRGQSAMTPGDQLDFAARWGEVSVHPYVPSIEGFPGVMKVYDPTPLTQNWHADTTHAPRPPKLTMLLSRVLPDVGGDTMWTNACAAYDGLSAGLRAAIDELRAIHRNTELATEMGLERTEVSHPVVRTHPQTGLRAIFVNGDYTVRFDGWTEAESAPLLNYLYQQVGRAEYAYRHRWRLGDLVIWDNRCTQHAVVGDTGGQERVLHRVTLLGDVPV